MESLILVLALYLSGLGTGWLVFDDEITHQHLTCPVVPKIDPIKELIVTDCIDGCPEGYVIKMKRETRGEIDRFARDCRSFETSIFNIIDGYNSKIEETSKELEKSNASK